MSERMARRYGLPSRATSGACAISRAENALSRELHALEADPALAVGEGRRGRDPHAVAPGLGAAEVERLEALGEVAAVAAGHADALVVDDPVVAHVVDVGRPVGAGPADGLELDALAAPHGAAVSVEAGRPVGQLDAGEG